MATNRPETEILLGHTSANDITGDTPVIVKGKPSVPKTSKTACVNTKKNKGKLIGGTVDTVKGTKTNKSTTETGKGPSAKCARTTVGGPPIKE